MTSETMTLSTTAPHPCIITNPNRGGARECLIALGLASYTYLGPESFALLPDGQYAWLGVLSDTVNLNAERDPSFVAFLSSHNDSIFERNLTVSRLQNLAYEHGYRQCEVRDYFHGTTDSYETLFSGPIYQSNGAVL